MNADSVAETRPFPLLLVMVVGLLALLSTAGVRSYRDLAAARAREGELAGRIDQARGEIERLEHRLELLEGDPATLERLAREELWMARPDELVIVLPAADLSRESTGAVSLRSPAPAHLPADTRTDLGEPSAGIPPP